MSCDDHRCVTCADEAVPLRVVAVCSERLAVCDGEVEVMTDLVGEVAPGEQLLVHAGVALARLTA
jgi:hydrogenase maturation factor